MLDLNKQPIGYMVQCPNCKQPTIPYSYEAGLLSDWCDACDKSIFDDSPNEADYWDGDETDKIPC